MIIINRRIREIISEVIRKKQCEQTITIYELADDFNVSSRTIRNDVAQVNGILEQNGLSVIRLGKNGEILVEKDISKVTGLINDNDLYYYKMSKEERQMFMVLLLICDDEYWTLSDLAEQMYVSRSTVIQDLDGVKEFFYERDMHLISHPNKGLHLNAEEYKKRKLMFDMVRINCALFKESSLFFCLLESFKDEKRVDAGALKKIENIINASEHKYEIYFTDTSFSCLKFYLSLSIYRTWIGKYVINYDKCCNDKVDMAKEILTHLCLRHGIEFGDSEVFFLSEILGKLKYIKKVTSSNQIVTIQVITKAFIGNISKKISVQLENDYIFYENLLNHLETMSTTVIEDIEDKNQSDVANTVMDNNPDIKKAVIENAYVIEKYLKRKLTSVEISYIVVHICAAIERNRNEAVRYSAVLVCNGGIGTSQLLLARLKKYFHFDVVDIIASHDLHNADLNNVDIVISTVAIKDTDIDYIQVEPLLTDEDYARIGEKLKKIHPNIIHMETDKLKMIHSMEKIRGIVESGRRDEEMLDEIKKVTELFFKKIENSDLVDLLPEKAITMDVECRNWKEAIRKSAEYLLENEYVEKRYVEAMIENVENHGPYIVVANGFALPHGGLDDGSKKVGLSLIRLKSPVEFGLKNLDPVKWVCCLSVVDKKKHLKAIFHLVNLFNNSEFRKAVKETTTSREVYETIKTYEYEVEK